MISGSLIGFLFGIPRTLQGQDDGTTARGTDPDHRPNTNLEQISDWLTKILVGVGLTQLSKIPNKLWILAETLGKGLGGQDKSAPFALALLGFFSVAGFLIGYLWTRVYFGRVLKWADSDGVEKLGQKIEQLDADLQQKVVRIDSDAASLAAAIAAAGYALDLAPPDKQEFALKDASEALDAQTDHHHVRTVAILRGRLRRALRDLNGATQVLQYAIDERKKRGIPLDRDTADLFYNVACYANLIARAEGEPDKQRAWRIEALTALSKAIEGNGGNELDAKDDPDLKDLLASAMDDIGLQPYLHPALRKAKGGAV